jgi:NAD(P)-dependent dehydrogenase (short-subunit alcohol dehydrogenase family)
MLSRCVQVTVAPFLTVTRAGENCIWLIVTAASSAAASAATAAVLAADCAVAVGAAVRFLLSREAGWITGQVLHVDGGLGAVRRFK